MTEASVVVDGTISVKILSPDKISLALHPNNGGASSSFSLERLGASTIHFSFRSYANDVRVVKPLVGPWQLGISRFSGSGTLAGSSISSTMHNAFNPHQSRYAPAQMRAVVVGYKYHRAPHGAYSTLNMTIQITESNAKNCSPGDRGTLKLLDTTAKLKNGKNGDAVGLHWPQRPLPDVRAGLDQRRWRREDEPQPRRTARRRPVGDREDLELGCKQEKGQGYVCLAA